MTVPVTILTGYLGSGKTTLIRRFLQTEAGARVAVLVNEFGEIGLDHHLLTRKVSGNTVVLRNGCICCSVRSELGAGLRELIDGRSRGELPGFDRILVETTGIADPVPVVRTLVADPMLRHAVRMAGLVATVDGRNGGGQLDAQPEAMRQAATADRLVITKTDLQEVDGLERRLTALNPTAPIVRTPEQADACRHLLGPDDASGSGRNGGDPHEWIERFRQLESRPGHHGSVRTFAWRTRRRIDWTAFSVWLSLLVHRHGREILRIKGLLDVPGENGPVVLNAVQHFIHPPVHLEEWPDDDHSSRMVFIVQNCDETRLRAALGRVLGEGEVAAVDSVTGETGSIVD